MCDEGDVQERAGVSEPEQTALAKRASFWLRKPRKCAEDLSQPSAPEFGPRTFPGDYSVPRNGDGDCGVQDGRARPQGSVEQRGGVAFFGAHPLVPVLLTREEPHRLEESRSVGVPRNFWSGSRMQKQLSESAQRKKVAGLGTDVDRVSKDWKYLQQMKPSEISDSIGTLGAMLN